MSSIATTAFSARTRRVENVGTTTEVVHSVISKQALPETTSQSNTWSTTIMEDRYYVQRLTEQIYLVRERLSVDEGPGPNDHIIRSFDIRHDAYTYADSINTVQRKLDEQDGHWAQHAHAV